jgi:hypothetical protein
MNNKIRLERKDVRVREAPPKVNPTKKGVEVLCPFCQPPHAILPGVETCGTTLKVMAVQTVLKNHATRYNKIPCLKCHQIGGEMVRYNNGFIHLVDCLPGTRLLTAPPKFSNTARIIFKLPAGARKRMERAFGRAQECREIDADGQETGKILGYFFLKG